MQRKNPPPPPPGSDFPIPLATHAAKSNPPTPPTLTAMPPPPKPDSPISLATPAMDLLSAIDSESNLSQSANAASSHAVFDVPLPMTVRENPSPLPLSDTPLSLTVSSDYAKNPITISKTPFRPISIKIPLLNTTFRPILIKIPSPRLVCTRVPAPPPLFRSPPPQSQIPILTPGIRIGETFLTARLDVGLDFDWYGFLVPILSILLKLLVAVKLECQYLFGPCMKYEEATN